MVPSSLIFPSKIGIRIGVSSRVMVSELPTPSTSTSGAPTLVAAGTATGLTTGATAGAVAEAVAGIGVVAGAATGLALDAVVRAGGSSANCCTGDWVRQPDKPSPAQSNRQTAPQRPKRLPILLILIQSESLSILLFDVQFSLIFRCGARPRDRFRLFAAVIVIVVIPAVIVIALILRHVDVIQHDAYQVAADFLDQLLGADVHRLRITAVLDNLQGHIHLAGEDRRVADAHDRR